MLRYSWSGTVPHWRHDRRNADALARENPYVSRIPIDLSRETTPKYSSDMVGA